MAFGAYATCLKKRDATSARHGGTYVAVAINSQGFCWREREAENLPIRRTGLRASRRWLGTGLAGVGSPDAAGRGGASPPPVAWFPPAEPLQGAARADSAYPGHVQSNFGAMDDLVLCVGAGVHTPELLRGGVQAGSPLHHSVASYRHRVRAPRRPLRPR